MYTCSLEGCKGAWGNVNDMLSHVKKERHLKNVLMKENPDKYQAAMPKNMVLIAAGELEAERGGDDYRSQQLQKIKVIRDDKKYRDLKLRPNTWSAPKDRRSSAANPNSVPLGRRKPMTPADVDKLLGIKPFVPESKTPAEEFKIIEKNMKFLHDVANEELNDLAADVENQAIDQVTFKARKKEIKAKIKSALAALPCLEDHAKSATIDERRAYAFMKNDLDAVQYKFLDIKFP